MRRRYKILKNAIRCKECGEVIESEYTHHFVPCKCFVKSKGECGCAVDGGRSYLRYVGNPDTFEILSETRPYTDEEQAKYEAEQRKIYEKYGWDLDKLR